MWGGIRSDRRIQITICLPAHAVEDAIPGPESSVDAMGTVESGHSLIRAALKNCDAMPDRTLFAFLDGSLGVAESLSFEALHRGASGVALELQAIARPGDRVLVLCPPGLRFITAFLGALYAGMVPVPLAPPKSRDADWEPLEMVCIDAAPSVALSTRALSERSRGLSERYPHLAALKWLASEAIGEASDFSPALPGPDALAYLQYTSGSTGTPKGVMVTHGNLAANLGVIQRRFGHSRNSQGLIWLPPHHDMGLVGGLLEPLHTGFPVALMSPLTFIQRPLRWLQAIARYGATTSGGPNFAYDLCVRQIDEAALAGLDLGSWQVAFNGSEPVKWGVLKAFGDKFERCGFRREALYPCYGMAESTLFVSGGQALEGPRTITADADALARNRIASPATDAGVSLVSCGRPERPSTVVIVNPDTRRVLPDAEIGEIWVTGPSVAAGYFRRPEATQATFEAQIVGRPGQGHLRTGDLGTLIDGELFVTGRLKEMIIVRGRNHYPQDLEESSANSHDAVLRMPGVAFGVSVDGEERVVIFQEVKREWLKRVVTQQVVEAIREAIVRDHGLVPHDIVLVNPHAVPLTRSGKRRRFECQDAWIRGRAPAISVSAASIAEPAELLAPPNS
jgi:acyl-CoA synthetase (AMP-forming)/AMP-acid ligase II